MNIISGEKSKIREMIGSCQFFSNVPPATLSSLENKFEIVAIDEGEVLFNQGDSPDHFYILISGKLTTFLTKANGQKIMVGHVFQLEPVGELGSFSMEPRSMTVIGNHDSILLRLPSVNFRDLCFQHPTVAAKLSRILVERSLKTLKLMTYERVDANVLLIYKNKSDDDLSLILKNKFFALRDSDLELVNADTIKIDEVEEKINNAKSKKTHLIFFMEEWNEVFFKKVQNQLTHFYIIVNEAEKEFTNVTKTILFELKKVPNIRNELIILHPETMKKIVNTRKWLEKADFTLHHHVRINNQNDFARLVRFMSGKAIVLVLGGGGAKGLSHLGVIKGILDSHLTIDAIAGSSVGAAVAACYALSLNYDQALAYMRKLKESSIKSLRYSKLVWPIISLFSSDHVTRTLTNLMENNLIEDLPIPYFAMVADVKNRNAIALKQGLIWEAVRSSGAVPGVFPPVAYNGHLFVDGGLLNNLPVDEMREIIGHGHIIIASSLSRKESEKPYYSFPPVLGFQQTLLLKMGIGKKKYVIPPFIETFLECLLLGSSAYEDYNARAADILVRANFKGFKTLSMKREDEEKLIKIGYDGIIKAINNYHEGKIYKRD